MGHGYRVVLVRVRGSAQNTQIGARADRSAVVPVRNSAPLSAPKSIHRARVPPLPIATLPHEYRRDCLEPARIPSQAPPLYGGVATPSASPLTGHLRLADFDLSVKLTRGQRRFSFVCAHRPSRATIHPPRRAGAKAEVPQRWLLAACRSARRSTCLPRSCTAKATTLALIGGGWAS